MDHASRRFAIVLLFGLGIGAAGGARAQGTPPATGGPVGASIAAKEASTEAQRTCDHLAAPPVPLARPAAEATPAIDWPLAITACTEATKEDFGNPRFEFELGRAYEETKNYAEAARHYFAAADTGSSEGQRALGVAYYKGLGVVQNKEKAFELFSRAAEAGNPYAMANLGAMFGNGDFVKRDDAKALDWFDKAIAAGDADALGQVGIAFFYGRGTPVDYKMAAQYFQQAADLGDGYSLKFLALIYDRGLVGPPDHVKAAALRQRAQQVDPNSDTPNVPLPRHASGGRGGARATRRSLVGTFADPNANNQFYTGSVAVNRWHGIATSLPRCWPICSLH